MTPAQRAAWEAGLAEFRRDKSRTNLRQPTVASSKCKNDWRRLHDPSVTRSLPFPGIMPGHGGSIPFRPCHELVPLAADT